MLHCTPPITDRNKHKIWERKKGSILFVFFVYTVNRTLTSARFISGVFLYTGMCMFVHACGTGWSVNRLHDVWHEARSLAKITKASQKIGRVSQSHQKHWILGHSGSGHIWISWFRFVMDITFDPPPEWFIDYSFAMWCLSAGDLLAGPSRSPTPALRYHFHVYSTKAVSQKASPGRVCNRKPLDSGPVATI